MKRKDDERENFWVAYADLMAGLLFVFILLVGGIIVKYMLVQTSLADTKISLEQKQQDFLNTLGMLNLEKNKTAELENLNKIFSDRLNELDIETKDLKKSNSIYVVQIDELEKLVQSLQNQNIDLDAYIKDLQALNQEQNETISENELKIAYFMEQISQKDKDLQTILNDLNITKNRIQNLAGIKVEIISKIKDSLGDSVNIDQDTGALTLSSSVLFDKGSYVLKDEAKDGLQNTLKRYFDTLLNDDDIRQNLDAIVIEGHTDSDGDYIYNLNLSQQRAFSVMAFINSWNTDERLKHYLTASGRSFMSPIIVDGVEDKDASRRIEIKFMISNKQTLQEIENFLKYDASKN
ncbi:MAG: OmpA family protein [Campylobacter sp.]|nr:OmpA family protein [Campylobacter sp.]